jgi:surface protein
MQLPTIIATDDTIHKIFKDQIAKYGNQADLNHIDVSRVTDMSELFGGSTFNGDISQWDVSNVTNMEGMFSNSRFNGDISKWNVSNVTNMSVMFENSDFNGDLSQWDVSNVIEMWYMFDNSSFNGDVSKWSIHPDCNIKGVLTQKEFILPPLLKIDDADVYTLRLREALNDQDVRPLTIKPSISKRYPNPTAAHAVYLLLSSSEPQTIHPQFRVSDRKKLQLLYQLTGSVYQSVVAWDQQRNNTIPTITSSLASALSR